MKRVDLDQGHHENPLVGWFEVEFTWLVSYYIVTDHSSFKFLRTLLFSYLHVVGPGGAGLAIKNFQCARNFHIPSVNYRAHHGWAWRKKLKIEVLRQLEHTILNSVFANRRRIQLLFESECTESVLDILF